MLEYTSERRCFLMASKGQKFNKYTEEQILEIVQRCISGESGYRLAEEYGISVGTIKTWKRKFVNHPELYTDNKRGRTKEKDLTKDDWKQRYEIIKKYRAFLKAQRERK